MWVPECSGKVPTSHTHKHTYPHTVNGARRRSFKANIPLSSDFLTWAETEMALFESLTVWIRGRVPTRLRRVARWRQGIAALHSRASIAVNGEAIRMDDAS